MLLLRAIHLAFTSTLFSQVYGSALAPVILSRATICNGHAEFCSRSYGNVSFVGAHDSYAIGVGIRESTSTNPYPSSLLSVELLFSSSQSRSKW
jgi:hypothetical protein